jgi:hypothetical protein
METAMTRATILDWTDTQVRLQLSETRGVQYSVYREDNRAFLEVRGTDNEHIHTLQLPDGMKLDKSSYEVLLRYVLLDVAAA